jgi:zinc-ribbon domain
VERHYCSYCGNRLEPDARFCSSCGRPVHRDSPAPDASTSQLPTSQPQSPQAPPLQSPQPGWAGARDQTIWHRGVEVRRGISWPMLALAGVLVILVVGQTMQAGMSEAIRAVPFVAVVVLVASAVSYLSLMRRGEATLREAVFNWSVVVLAAFATLLFLIS